jgi:hypothetical protein
MPSIKPKTSRSIGKLDTKKKAANTKFVLKKKIVSNIIDEDNKTIKESQQEINNQIDNLDTHTIQQESIINNNNININIDDNIDNNNNDDNIDNNNNNIDNNIDNIDNNNNNDNIDNIDDDNIDNDNIDDDNIDDDNIDNEEYKKEHKSRRRNKNYGRETRYNKKKIDFEFGFDNNDDEITGQQETLMIPLTKFFKHENNIERILPILKGQSPVSLRIIDWFVTNYSKQNGTYYDINQYKKQEINDGKEISVVSNFDSLFFVYYNYRCQLKSFYKKKFDPFCRRTKIQFYYQPDKYIITTVGQLNFFRWAIKNYVLNYIEQHLEEIEEHMNNNIKVIKVNDSEDKKISSPKNINHISGKTKRHKRKEISPSAMKSITKYESPVTINFS